MNRAPFFNEQFTVVNAQGQLVPAADYQLYTWQAGGTTVGQETYEDQEGNSPNSNPIPLDADGRCNLWLDPALEYAIELREPVAMGGSSVWVRDNVVGSAATTGVVLSVNDETGDVELTADDIGFESSLGLTWFNAEDVGAALDQLAERADAPEAETVSITDTGGFFTADNVEDALQELGASKLPDPEEDKVLMSDGSDPDDMFWGIARTQWRLAAPGGTSGARTVRLPAGEYQVTLESRCYVDTPGGPFNNTQSATVQTGGSGGVTLNTTMNFSRTGGSGHGYLIHATDLDADTLLVPTENDYVITINAMTLLAGSGKGSIVTIERVL